MIYVRKILTSALPSIVTDKANKAWQINPLPLRS